MELIAKNANCSKLLLLLWFRADEAQFPFFGTKEF